MAKGFTQVEGIDFHEFFSPVVKHSSIRTLLDIVAMEGLELHQLDVKIAFLHGELKEEIFVKQTKGFEVKGEESHVFCLKKSLYGLKQSPRQWYKNLICLCFHMTLQGAPMIVVSILRSLMVGLLYI